MRFLLGDAIFWVAAACCLVAQAAILRSTLIPHEPGPGSERVPRPRSAAEVGWVVVPTLALIGVFALTWQTMHRSHEPSELRGSPVAVEASAPSNIR